MRCQVAQIWNASRSFLNERCYYWSQYILLYSTQSDVMSTVRTCQAVSLIHSRCNGWLVGLNESRVRICWLNWNVIVPIGICFLVSESAYKELRELGSDSMQHVWGGNSVAHSELKLFFLLWNVLLAFVDQACSGWCQPVPVLFFATYYIRILSGYLPQL